MAKKKLDPLEDPPKSSSSDDDEVETPSEEDEAEEQISDDSSSEEEDDLMNPVIIPPSTKTRNAVASGSKKPTAVTAASPSKPGSKRSSEQREISPKKVHAKRSKKEDNKKPLFQRLWSEEDEISLLQGMIDFKFETEKSPYEDMDEFYEFIKKSISFEASKCQTVEKIRSLRKKYMKKVKKGVDSIPKAHDMECYKLSKYIWGSNGLALKPLGKKIDSVKPHGKEVEKEVEFDGSLKKKLDFSEANGEDVEVEREVLDDGDKEEKEEEDREMLVNGKNVQVDKEVLVNGDSKSPGVMRASDWFEDSFLVGSITSLGVGERFVKQKWSMVAVETKKKMEEKWMLLQAKEMELVLQKTDFMREVGSVIAEASLEGTTM